MNLSTLNEIVLEGFYKVWRLRKIYAMMPDSNKDFIRNKYKTMAYSSLELKKL